MSGSSCASVAFRDPMRAKLACPMMIGDVVRHPALPILGTAGPSAHQRQPGLVTRIADAVGPRAVLCAGAGTSGGKASACNYDDVNPLLEQYVPTRAMLERARGSGAVAFGA